MGVGLIVLTDVVGFALLVPGVRRLIQLRLVRWAEQRIRMGHASFDVSTFGSAPRSGAAHEGEVINVTAELTDDDSGQAGPDPRKKGEESSLGCSSSARVCPIRA